MATADVVFGIRAGLIPASSLVWRDGMLDWLRLEEVPIFRLAALGAATRSTPPPTVDAGDGPELTIGVEEAVELDAEPAPAVETAPPPVEPVPAAVAEESAEEPAPVEPAPREKAPEDATPIVRVPRAEDETPIVRVPLPEDATPIVHVPRAEDETPVEPAPRTMAPEDATPVERAAAMPPPPSSRPPRRHARASATAEKTTAPTGVPSEPDPSSEPRESVPDTPPRKSRPERSRPQSLRPAPDARAARPSGSPPPVPVRSHPPAAAARPSGSPPPVPVRSRPSSRPPGDDDVTRVKAPGMIPEARSRPESAESPRPKVEAREAPRVITTRSMLGSSAKQAESGDDEPALAVYSRPVPTLAFARPELAEPTPDPVAHALVGPRRSSSPSIELRPASIAPGEVIPTGSVPPAPNASANLADDLPDFTSSLRPGSSRATIAIAAAAVVAAVVIGLSIRSGSRSPSRRAAAQPSAQVPAQRASPAESAPRVEASASPPVEPTAVASATPSRPTPVAAITRSQPAEAAEPAVSPPARRREPLARQLSSAADDSVSRLETDETEPAEKAPSKSARRPAATESGSGLEDPAPAKTSEVGADEKRRVLTEPGF